MRQYLAPAAPDKNGLLTVSGKDYRYMRHVLRLVAGDMVQVRLPDGTAQNTTVCKVDEGARQIVLQVCASPRGQDETADAGAEQNASPTRAATDMWLFQFVAKSAKMDVIVRQATECGISTIIPVLGEFSQNGGAEKNFRSERLLRIIKEARQQSGSAVATRILDAESVEQAIALWHDYCAAQTETATDRANGEVANGEVANGDRAGAADSFAAVLYERTEHTVPLHTAVGERHIARAALVVGAEGGISPAELALLRAGGFVPVHFETNILRCETAAVYGIAALQTALTEKDVWQCRE